MSGPKCEPKYTRSFEQGREAKALFNLFQTLACFSHSHINAATARQNYGHAVQY